MHFKFLALAGLAGFAVAQQTPTLVQALNSTTELANLTQIIQGQPGLAEQLAGLTNITILAPDNNAISAFLNLTTASGAAPTTEQINAILTYHVLNGTYQNFTANAQFIRTALVNSPQFTNVTTGQVVEVQNTTVFSGLKANSSIIQQSINFTGGVIHVINSVLTLPVSISETATDFNLTSFYGALNATMSLATVNGLSNVTVFVPNNAAFRNIGSALPNLTTEEAASILQYHIIEGTVAYSSSLTNESVPSLQGNNLTITVHNASSVFVNNARVVIPDILVANGVVHVIDEVLNPNNATAANGTQSAGQPAFSGASSATEEPYTSGQPTPTRSINTSSIQASATGAASSSSSGAAWVPRPTGAVGAAALGGLALILQL